MRASVGAFHLCLWAFTLTEAWAWGRASDILVGHRSSSPWDDSSRRPSHADKRRAWRRELLAGEIRAALRPGRRRVRGVRLDTVRGDSYQTYKYYSVTYRSYQYHVAVYRPSQPRTFTILHLDETEGLRSSSGHAEM